MSDIHILIVDDSKTARSFLSKSIARISNNPTYEADTGNAALEILNDIEVGAIILDHNLPDMNGIEFLKVKNDEANWHSIPVLVMTSEDLNDELIAEYFRLNATDFIPKNNLHQLIFSARVQRCLNMYDAVKELQKLNNQLSEFHAKQERLLQSTLPKTVYREILETGHYRPISPKDAAVLFVDVCGFTKFAAEHGPAKLVTNLNRMINRFERISADHNLDKIKTIGDEFMAVSGVFEKTYSLSKVVDAGFRMIKETEELDIDWKVKVGIATGPLVGGIIGSERRQFDVWGNTVNLAARMCNSSGPGQIAIRMALLETIKDKKLTIETVHQNIKGFGPTEIALLSTPLSASF